MKKCNVIFDTSFFIDFWRKKYVKLQEKALKIDNNDESRIILEKIKKNVGNKN